VNDHGCWCREIAPDGHFGEQQAYTTLCKATRSDILKHIIPPLKFNEKEMRKFSSIVLSNLYEILCMDNTIYRCRINEVFLRVRNVALLDLRRFAIIRNPLTS